jgi:hypothetical protein
VFDKHIGWKDLGSFLFVMVFLGINIDSFIFASLAWDI